MFPESYDIKITSRLKHVTAAARSGFSSGSSGRRLYFRTGRNEKMCTKYSVIASASSKPEDRLLIIVLDTQAAQTFVERLLKYFHQLQGGYAVSIKILSRSCAIGFREQARHGIEPVSKKKFLLLFIVQEQKKEEPGFCLKRNPVLNRRESNAKLRRRGFLELPRKTEVTHYTSLGVRTVDFSKRSSG